MGKPLRQTPGSPHGWHTHNVRRAARAAGHLHRLNRFRAPEHLTAIRAAMARAQTMGAYARLACLYRAVLQGDHPDLAADQIERASLADSLAKVASALQGAHGALEPIGWELDREIRRRIGS